RPQDRVTLANATSEFGKALSTTFKHASPASAAIAGLTGPYAKASLEDGDVTLAAITSCTNTSNPSVLFAAGLVARKARALGLTRKPWVKTSLAPGSQVVTDYLTKAGLQADLDAIGFNTVGYGCTTCIGNSGPLDDNVIKAVETGDLVVAGVLSGNRNFEGRISPHIKANYLASPPLVVAYALFGTMNKDITTAPIGKSKDGKDVFLKDIWPSPQEVSECIEKFLTKEMFKSRYSDVFRGPAPWQAVKADKTETYAWPSKSTYVANPPYFAGMGKAPKAINDIKAARPLAILGDSVTTDHISPAGSIKKDSPAGKYLIANGVQPKDFNSYGARRGHHEVMMRGTFANIRIKNEMVPGVEGGVTKHQPSGEQLAIYDAAMKYQGAGVPLVIVAGKEYGTGSSRDWAAKGTNLLGVKAVLVESFERIHRSNLVGMGVLPLQFKDGTTRKTLGLDGTETFDIAIGGLKPRGDVQVVINRANGKSETVTVTCRIDTDGELDYYKNGGVLHYVLRNLAA
ncbi:MAG: aconitate hydratase AcnA, partial [Alphaproteobacteria bacterium]|nr:aconitate hydratase AcnA [Alphaproteobacteria bacterium]